MLFFTKLAGILTTLSVLTSAQRSRDLWEWANRDCYGDSTVCIDAGDGVCCTSGFSNARSGQCRDCTDRELYLIYSGGGCRTLERGTTGDTCVNVAAQSGQRWSSNYQESLDRGLAPCTDTVEPDLISIGGTWFRVNESITEDDKQALWKLWGKGVSVPEDLLKYEADILDSMFQGETGGKW
ncbi:hypothetical protein BJX99DRAFT_224941 [Aspergillus californicus]